MPPPQDGMPAGPAGRGRLRASHIDREHVVGMLKAAFVQGRLTKSEFDARVGQALTARTYAELGLLTADLPACPPLRRPAQARARPPRRKLAKPAPYWTTAAAASGLLAGIVSATLYPPTFTSSAHVVTSPSYDPVTQVAMARSAPVMAGALFRLDSGGPTEALRDRVQVKSLTSNILSVSAQGDTATQAERAADAVADSFVAYTSSITPPGQVPARVLDPALSATETPRSTRLFVFGGLGALLGALFGVISRQAFRRSRRRFLIQ
jgi:Domain of unknown function (DUF1707)